ncbi:MAG TPA: hypothetical protein VEI97_17975, partial [bacterium]|nr:hypothetical protein [bacterium]
TEYVLTKPAPVPVPPSDPPPLPTHLGDPVGTTPSALLQLDGGGSRATTGSAVSTVTGVGPPAQQAGEVALVSPPTTGPPSSATSGGSRARPRGDSTGQSSGPDAMDAVLAVAGKGAFPLLLVLIVIVFLVVQDWIDRKDPKLMKAPMRSEALDFIEAPSGPIGK